MAEYRKRSFPLISVYWLTGIFFFITSCANHEQVDPRFRKQTKDPKEVKYLKPDVTPVFKAHLKSGEVCVFESWHLTANEDSLAGTGSVYNYQRIQTHQGEVIFPLSEIAIIETNQPDVILSKDNVRIAALAVVTGVNFALDLVCITNPKSCFGSCPTFYVEGRNEFFSSAAEGFSSAIAPSLEMSDIDALRSVAGAGPYRITLKNEALETHVINAVHLMAAVKKTDERVFHTRPGKFYRCSEPLAPVKATSGDMDVKGLLAASDDSEYFSQSDSVDLSAREEIILEFANREAGLKGLAVNFRQTLMTTFLLYNGLGYMGDDVGYYFSAIERKSSLRKHIYNPFHRLGMITFQVWDAQNMKWIKAGELHETGPIAHNIQLVQLDKVLPEGPVKIRITMTKGMWRLDQVGLTSVYSEITPVRIRPDHTQAVKGHTPSAEALDSADTSYLVSLPGDEYTIDYTLPALEEGMEHEMFLESTGYYIEWIRQEWMQEENPARLKGMLLNSDKVWRSLAEEFKAVEPSMESLFWNSKISREP